MLFLKKTIRNEASGDPVFADHIDPFMESLARLYAIC